MGTVLRTDGRTRLGVILAAVVLALSLSCAFASHAQAAQTEISPQLQTTQLSAQANANVTDVTLYWWTGDSTGTWNDDKTTTIYNPENTNKSMSGVSYNPSTGTLTLDKANDPRLNVDISGTGTLNVVVKGDCKLHSIDLRGIGVHFTGEGTLTVNENEHTSEALRVLADGNNCTVSADNKVGLKFFAGKDHSILIDLTSQKTQSKALQFNGYVEKLPASSSKSWKRGYAVGINEDGNEFISDDGYVVKKDGKQFLAVEDGDWQIYRGISGTSNGDLNDLVESVAYKEDSVPGYEKVYDDNYRDYFVSGDFVQTRLGLPDNGTAVVSGCTYQALDNTAATVVFKKAPKSKKSVTIPATVTISGKAYTVVGIAKKAFSGTKVKTVTVKTSHLTKKSVKGCFKGAKKLKTVKVKVGNKKTNKRYVKAYKKAFAKKNSGKKVTVK